MPSAHHHHHEQHHQHRHHHISDVTVTATIHHVTMVALQAVTLWYTAAMRGGWQQAHVFQRFSSRRRRALSRGQVFVLQIGGKSIHVFVFHL